MTWFEKPNPNKPRVWSKDAVFELAKQFKTKSDFRKANKSAYNVAWRNNWLEEMYWFEESLPRPYTKEEILSIARRFTTKTIFAKPTSVHIIQLKKGVVVRNNLVCYSTQI